MKAVFELIAKNRRWADSVTAECPDFFAESAKGQAPEYLWIGCADSRVATNLITGLEVGEIFVHRNIANLVVDGDNNLASVVQYAVDALKVPHIIVCGHYGCGGVLAAMEPNCPLPAVEGWINHIRTVSAEFEGELTPLDQERKFARLCELNAISQANNLSRNETVKAAWARGQRLSIHSMIYDLASGHLKNPGRTDKCPPGLAQTLGCQTRSHRPAFDCAVETTKSTQ